MADLPSGDIRQQARKALQDDDPATLRQLLHQHPLLKARINAPVADFGSPPVTCVRSIAMLDALLETGADINARSRWWAGGSGLLDTASPELAAYAIAHGAVITSHAAARLGLIGNLQQLLAADPQLVHARGGDGQTPLHFASTPAIAESLLDHGAEIDARAIDHESTPAQYMLRNRPEIARYLIHRGCATDLLMAAALGDTSLVLEHLDANPECIRMRAGDECFPMISPRNGGAIYQWELGRYVSACQVARSFGHADLFPLLMERCPPELGRVKYES